MWNKGGKLEIDHSNIYCMQDLSMDAKIREIGTGCFHHLKVSSPDIY